MGKQFNKNITTVLFDFDGVIADTETGRYALFTDVLAAKGIDFKSRVAITQMQGLTGRAMIERYFPEIPPLEVKEIVERRQGMYMSNLDKYCKPYPGAADTIRALKSKGYYIVSVTANTTEAAKILLKHVGVMDYFDKVLGVEYCENKDTGKKDYGLVSGIINKPVPECVVIEDSLVGVKGAVGSGYYTIAFDRFPGSGLEKHADRIIYTYNELNSIFGLEV